MLKSSLIVFSGLILSHVSFAQTAPAKTVSVKNFSPQGLSDTVNQVKVEFSTKMVNLSQPAQNAGSVFEIKCTPELKGLARWQNQTTWSYDFQTGLPGNKLAGGTKCQFDLKASVKSLDGKSVSDTKSFLFQIDGPNILSINPNAEVVEDQVFIVTFDTPVIEDSFLQNSYFLVDGKANRITLDLVKGELRKVILKNNYIDEAKSGERVFLVKARELFPAKTALKLYLGAGLTSKASAVSKQKTSSFKFKVRAGFTAEFSCERENAKANCIPLSTMNVQFSSQISIQDAQKIYLEGAGVKVYPDFSKAELSNTVDRVSFKGPFPANGQFNIVIPSDLKDDSGRSLFNSTKFPLSVQTDDMPPLAKFSSNFGILEAKQDILLPVTVRNLESQVPGASALVGKSIKLGADNFSSVVSWLKNVNTRRFEDRAKSIFSSKDLTSSFQIPLSKNGKAFEVVGIPLSGPGFYAVELKSDKLGKSLLGKDSAMFVPTTALVTDLSIHLKWGRENSIFWVTSLDKGVPVANAKVKVYNCSGTMVWESISDSQGLVKHSGAIAAKLGKSCENDATYSELNSGFFVTAELNDDFTFSHSSWKEGIETWRFGHADESLQTQSPSYESDSNVIAHTVFDRTQLKNNETLHMKHIIRKTVGDGFSMIAEDKLPTKAVIKNYELDTKFEIPLKWNTKNYTAVSEFKIPQDAALGGYAVTLVAGKNEFSAGQFRVEAFKVPLYKSTIILPKDNVFSGQNIDVLATISYQNGGPISGLAGTLRHYFTPIENIKFDNYEGFYFSNGVVTPAIIRNGESSSEGSAEKVASQSITLDVQGAAKTSVSNLNQKSSNQPQILNIELEYKDSNGETQTTSQSKKIWSSDRHIGVKVPQWVATGKNFEFQVATTDLKGNALPSADFSVAAFKTTYYSHRTRLVGGFYSYESLTEIKEVPVTHSCQAGKTNEKGLAICQAQIKSEGQISLVVSSKDAQNRSVSAKMDFNVTGKDRMWFGADNDDRIDLMAEKKLYNSDETARFQVRMPFKDATALITVEREGVLSSEVIQISDTNPTISVPLKVKYAPNVYVSAFVVRGRVAGSSSDSTAMVDLSKPSFKFGLTKVNVNWKPHSLRVKVTPNKTVYAPREEATVKIDVLAPNSKIQLPADSEVTVAVIDEGLLAIAPNSSWDLLKQMMRVRPLEVETATMQMQVIGKRHFGLKAVPHGGGGGSGQRLTRELFDTLVYWNGSVKLDDKGQAVVKFKMNDSLTGFRVVVIANGGKDLFGMAQTTITSNQNLITTTSLPVLSHIGDQFKPEFTFRNTAKSDMKGEIQLQAIFKLRNGNLQNKVFKPSSLAISGGTSKTIAVDDLVIPDDAESVVFEAKVVDEQGTVLDTVRQTQTIKSSQRISNLMSSLKQISPNEIFDVEKPQNAVGNLGGVSVSLTPSLAYGLDSVSEYLKNYPFSSIETQISAAVIQFDQKQWKTVTAQLPAYLDANGLVKFYPNSESGSEILTAYILSISKMGALVLPDNVKNPMIAGLKKFVSGKLARQNSGNQSATDLLANKAFANETLARVDKIEAAQISELFETPSAQLSTGTLVSLVNILGLLKNDAMSAKKAGLIKAIEARTTLNSASLSLDNSNNDGNWLVNSSDSNTSRWILAVLTSGDVRASFESKIPDMVRGLLSKNGRGYWDTTAANVYATLALRSFSSQYEKTPVTGLTNINSAAVPEAINMDWSKQKTGVFKIGWLANGKKDSIKIHHQGDGSPWALVSTQAALKLSKPLISGIEVSKKLNSIKQNIPNQWTVGDIIEVEMKIKSNVPVNQVALMDPLPTGARIINSNCDLYSFEQKSYESYKAFFDYVPNTEFSVKYQMELNHSGVFKLPSTRVEAKYNPAQFGEIPNSDLTVLNTK